MDVKAIKQCIDSGDMHPFYTSREWLRLRAKVLKAQHYECQLCKRKGRYRKAKAVHHMNYVRSHPELALSERDGKGKLNLIAVCDECHKEIHRPRPKWNDEKW